MPWGCNTDGFFYIMKPTDIFKFLIGDRAAIQRVAGSWWAILVGALLVILGGLSRNYDHLDLIHNPEWIIGPYIASVITSLVVFACVYPYLGLWKVTKTNALDRTPGTSYLSFLSIYWMTAPCALLYAIPVESFTDLVTATKWNITFLALVSIWRVALMTRALNVLTGASLFTSFTAILFPASVMMCIGSLFKSLSLVGIMGGVKLPPHTEILQKASNFTMVVSFWLAVASLCIIMYSTTFNKSRKTATQPLPWKKTTIPRNTLIAACLIILICALMTIPHQIKVQRNHNLESLIKKHQYSEAVRYASQFQKKDFSTIHYLPPDPYQRQRGNKEKYRKLIALLDGTEPEWLKEAWSDQYTQCLLGSQWGLSKPDAEFIQNYPKIKQDLIDQTDPDDRERLFESLDEPQQPEHP